MYIRTNVKQRYTNTKIHQSMIIQNLHLPTEGQQSRVKQTKQSQVTQSARHQKLRAGHLRTTSFLTHVLTYWGPPERSSHLLGDTDRRWQTCSCYTSGSTPHACLATQQTADVGAVSLLSCSCLNAVWILTPFLLRYQLWENSTLAREHQPIRNLHCSHVVQNSPPRAEQPFAWLPPTPWAATT